MKLVQMIVGVFGAATLVLACGGADPAPSTGSESTKAPTATQPVEGSVEPLTTCTPGNHLCRSGCGGTYCEADGVDCAVCRIFNHICECQ
jgi:hypothetical protein